MWENNFYRPQRSCGKIMFSQASVILFTGGGVSDRPLGQNPLSRHTPGQTPYPWADTPPPADGYCSGQYASYWNAFLFVILWQCPVCDHSDEMTGIRRKQI